MSMNVFQWIYTYVMGGNEIYQVIWKHISTVYICYVYVFPICNLGV